MNITIAVAFHSDRGHVRRLAERVTLGAAEVDGVVADSWDLNELSEELWQAVGGADAIVFGSPTYIWVALRRSSNALLRPRCPSGLAKSGDRKWRPASPIHEAMSGDKLNTLQYFSLLAAQHGMVWVNLDLLPGWCWEAASRDDLNRLGAWLGVMSQSNGDGPMETNPCVSDLRTAEHLGRRVAVVTRALVVGRREVASKAVSLTADG